MSSRFVIRRCILLSSASYPHLIHILSYPHHCCRRYYVVVASFYWRLVVIFVCYLITAYRHIGVVHLEDLVGPRQRYRAPRETSRHCAPQRSQPFAYGTRQRSRPFANGKNRQSISLGLKPSTNRSWRNGR